MAFSNATFCIDLARAMASAAVVQKSRQLPAKKKAAIANIHLLGPDEYDWSTEPEMPPFETLLLNLSAASIRPKLVGIHTNFQLPKTLEAFGFYALAKTQIETPWARFLYAYLMHNPAFDFIRIIEDAVFKSPMVTLSRLAVEISGIAAGQICKHVDPCSYEQDLWTMWQSRDSQIGTTMKVWSDACSVVALIRLHMSYEYAAASKVHREQ